MSWLLAVFPSWNPDAATSLAWYDELKNFQPMAVKDAVKQIRAVEPSSFPPGVFEIKNTILVNRATTLDRPYLLDEPSIANEQWERNKIKAREVIEILSKKFSAGAESNDKF